MIDAYSDTNLTAIQSCSYVQVNIRNKKKKKMKMTPMTQKNLAENKSPDV